MRTPTTDEAFAINTALIEAAQRQAAAPGFIARGLDRLARSAVLARLRGIRHGRLRLVDESLSPGDASRSFGQPTLRAPLDVTVRVHDPRFYADVAFGGSVGAGEAYMQGWWTTNDLTGAMRILLQNREVLDGMETGLARLAEPARKALHWASRNTRTGSRRNISAHYDLGNDFFSLFLDPTMMYSSAVFERPDMTLEEASIAKLDRICRKLDLRPGDRVMEIGTGWGGFAMHAARHFGCHVTTTTISRQQHDMAKQRIAAAGLSDRITLLFEDYRDLRAEDLGGEFDKLVSIEMIEAVGHDFYDSYFAKCSELLRPDGQFLLQAITIADQRYEAARKAVDFIQRYIFPGSCIPSVAVMTDSVARVSDLRLFHQEDIGPHYATTLRMWRENFFAHIDAVRRLGYPEHFNRMWEFYLCYCEAGFTEQALGDVHMLFVKPQARRQPLLAF